MRIIIIILFLLALDLSSLDLCFGQTNAPRRLRTLRDAFPAIYSGVGVGTNGKLFTNFWTNSRRRSWTFAEVLGTNWNAIVGHPGDTNHASRVLTAQQETNAVGLLSVYSRDLVNKMVSIDYPSGDLEAKTFASQIADIFSQSGYGVAMGPNVFGYSGLNEATNGLFVFGAPGDTCVVPVSKALWESHIWSCGVQWTKVPSGIVWIKVWTKP